MRARFTLVELMIVVAIISILAAIAIPNFRDMQLSAKRAEVYPNVQGIGTAVDAWIADAGAPLLTGSQVPRAYAALDGTAAAWISGSNFDTLGWSPDGDVRGHYSFSWDSGGSNSASVFANIDVDDDDVIHYYDIVKLAPIEPWEEWTAGWNCDDNAVTSWGTCY